MIMVRGGHRRLQRRWRTYTIAELAKPFVMSQPASSKRLEGCVGVDTDRGE